MKKKLFFYALMLLAFTANATVRTVDNNVNSPAQFTTLQAGIDGSSAGDTLYVSGSIYTYGNSILNKRLTLIGAGHNPLNEISIPTLAGNIFLDSTAGITGPSGSRIIGFKLNVVYMNGNAVWRYKNVEIADNYFYNSATFTDMQYCDQMYIHNNIFYQGNFYFGDNCIISNNIYIAHPNGLYQTGQNSIFSHNIFLGAINNTVTPSWTGNTFENNIFDGIKMDTTGINTNGCSFYNNIGYGGNYITLPFGVTNAGTGNILLQNPQFVNVPLLTAFNYTYNYHLQPTSPGHLAATDGTDIGLYGGPANSVPDLTGMARIPYMKYLHLNQTVIAPTDSLDVQFKAIKHD